MPSYAVRLDVRTSRPLTAERIADLQGGRWKLAALGKPRGRRLTVSLVMDGSDPAGALIRAQNIVLDQVPGEVIRAEVELTPARGADARRRRGRSTG